jgi:hypothetical protein
MKSIPIFYDIIKNNKTDYFSEVIFGLILRETQDNQIISDPFILAFQSSAETTISHPKSSIRLNAMKLLLRLPLSENQRKTILENGLTDTSTEVREFVLNEIKGSK